MKIDNANLHGMQNSTWALFIIVHKLIQREIHYAVGSRFVEPHTLTKECYHFVRRMDELRRYNTPHIRNAETV